MSTSISAGIGTHKFQLFPCFPWYSLLRDTDPAIGGHLSSAPLGSVTTQRLKALLFALCACMCVCVCVRAFFHQGICYLA